MPDPQITKCLIDVNLALALRELARSLGLDIPGGQMNFSCPQCGQSLKPHHGTSPAPHFEHLSGHRPCSYSDSRLIKLKE